MQQNKTHPLSKLRSQNNSAVDPIYSEQIKFFPSTANGKTISIQEFSEVDPNDLEIFVVRPVKKIVSVLSHVEYLIEVKIKNVLRYKVQRRFRDFDSLDIALKQKFQNLKFPEIPSKTQILKKEQTRIKYYNDLFYHFKKYALEYPNLKQRLLKVVYILLINDSQPIKLCTHERIEINNSGSKDNMMLNSGNYDSSLLGSNRSDSKVETGYQNYDFEEENDQKEKDFEVFLGYMEDNTIIADRGRFGATEITSRPSKEQINQHKQGGLQERRKTRRGSINQDEIDKVKQIDLLDRNKSTRELDLNPGLYYKMHQDMKQLHNKDVHIGYCWVKFPLSNQWQRLFARVQDSCIKFCKDVQVNEFLTSYVIYNCRIDTMKIKITEWDNKIHQVMIIRHEFDSEWLLMAVEDEKLFYQKRQDLLAKSLEHSKTTMDVINETNRYAFGKIKVRVKHLCDVPNIGKLFIRLKLGPFIMETRRVKAPTQYTYKFSQDFIIPITNRYDQIQIHIISYVTSGLFQGNHKETIVKEFLIPLPFLKEEQFQRDKIGYTFPLEDLKKGNKLLDQINSSSDNFLNMLGMQTNQISANVDKTQQPKFEIQIKDLSQFTAMVMFNPNRDVVEDRPKKKEYSRKEINLTISKLVLTIYKISDIEEIERLIFYFRYPKLSNFLRIALVLFLIYFDPQYLLSYLLGIVIFVFILKNENWHGYTFPLLNYLFFNKINDYLNEEKGSKIITFRQDSIKKNMRTLLSVNNDNETDKTKNKKKKQPNQGNQKNNWVVDEDYMQDEDNHDQEGKYERRQFGILEKYRDLKNKLAILVFFFDVTTDFIEKLNKLLIWQDQKASKLFLIILIIIFFVISFLPLRYFILLAILKKFNRGSTYYKRRYTGNKEAIKIELRNFLLTHGHLKYEDLKKYGESYWMNRAWPNKRGFEKNLINYLQDKLYILIPKGFQLEFKTPIELIECAGYIDQVLELKPRDENEWELRNNKNLYRKSPNPLVYLYNFIMNNIASMIYLHKNKKYLKIDNSC